MFYAELDRQRGWRVKVDYTVRGGTVLDICGAVDEFVARATAVAMNGARNG